MLSFRLIQKEIDIKIVVVIQLLTKNTLSSIITEKALIRSREAEKNTLIES